MASVAQKIAVLGLTAPPNRIKVFPAPGLIGASLSTVGTSTLTVAGTIYYTEMILPTNMLVTGVAVLNGAIAGGTDTGQVGIWDNSGTLQAQTAASVTSGVNTLQQRALLATKTLVMGRYWVGYQSNGATDSVRLFATGTFLDIATTIQAGTYPTLAPMTPVQTFTALNGAVVYLY